MKSSDIVVIGAGTSGAYLAKAMSDRGWKVTVIEKLKKADVGTKYDIFHIEAFEFERLNLPRPKKGDKEWAFEFSLGYTADPMNKYPRKSISPVVGLHMHEYTLLLNELAKNSGANIIYGAEFEDFIFEDGKISGVIYKQGSRSFKLGAKVVIDCSGIPAAARCRLPEDYGIETNELADDDMFYVILRYVKLLDEKDYLNSSCGWPFFKSWIAPCADPHGAIIGIGACHSYDYAQKIYDKMLEHIKLPAYELDHMEYGCTPFRRPPYNFVADNFIIGGDAACLTKAMNGEGVISSIVQLKIVAGSLDYALRKNDTSKKALWNINVRYNALQGAEFASTRALLVGVVNAATFDEFEFAFESGIISDELMSSGAGGAGFDLSPAFLIKAVGKLIGGIVSGKVSMNTIKAAVQAVKNSDEAKTLYLNFPENPDYFETWRKKADCLWSKVGKIK